MVPIIYTIAPAAATAATASTSHAFSGIAVALAAPFDLKLEVRLLVVVEAASVWIT